ESPTSSLTNGASGGTVPARLRPNKLPLCAKSWPIIPIHSLSPICWEFRRTLNFPAVHPRALRHQNLANRQSRASHPNRKGSARVSRFSGSARALAKRIFPLIGRVIKESRIYAGKLIVRDLANAYSGLLIACRTPMNFPHSHADIKSDHGNAVHMWIRPKDSA